VKNLRFYNKEGYPYNFQYNEENDKWEGKILFDPNSSDLYKTIGIYLFEHVEPISFAEYFNFNKFELYNDSGIILKGSTKQGLDIEGIKKSNNSPVFRTKWIKGRGFHQLFPEGTIVRFVLSGANYTDFDDALYFNVLETRKNEILIQTTTTNDTFLSFTYISGKIYSCDVIKYPDYNQGYSAYLASKIYVGKQLSIVNSEKNSGVVEVADREILKRNIYDYQLSGNTNCTLNLEVTLLTDRILLHSGSVTVTGNKFVFSEPFGNSFKIGQNIIFEDYNGGQLLNGYQYTVSSINDRVSVKTAMALEFYEYYDENLSDESEYYVRSTSTLNVPLVANDIIYFAGAGSLNTRKDFKVLNSYIEDGYTYIQLEQFVHEENITNMAIVKRLRFYEYNTFDATGIAQTQTIDGNCYLTTNILNYKQNILPAASGFTIYHETINAFVENYNNDLNKLGINSYLLDDKLFIEGLYDFSYSPYFTTKLYLEESGTTVSTISNQNSYSVLDISDIHYIFTEEKLYNEKIYLYETNKLSKKYNEEILFDLYDDVLDYGFCLTLNDVEYFINFQDNSGTTNKTQETIKDFVNKYYTALYNKGVDIHTGTTIDNKLYIETLYPDVAILNLKVKVNLNSSYDILYQAENEFRSEGIILTGNQLDMAGTTDLYTVGLSTGMVISVSGSSYNENDKEYNIIGLSPTVIQLSYQGVFFEENNIILDIDSREYIRKPRLSYDKDIYFKLSWIPTDEHPIDDSIFFYDISGNQLQPPKDSSGNYIEKLRYDGQIPLWDYRQQNVIRLNKEPNTKLEHITNPKYQQTIFSELNFLLPQLDSDDDFNYLPRPFEIFIGYNTPNEGVNYNIMKIELIETIIFSGTTGISDNYFVFNTDGTIEYKSNLFDGFINKGFEVGQPIQVKISDTNPYDQSIFENYETYTLVSVLKNKLIVDITNTESDFVYFNSSGKTFNFSISVQPKEIARFSIYGETEVEDERFDINLKNLGIRINKEEEMIFKESDIEEDGIDYTLLNQKRKEMLLMYPKIYNYIGAYKSLMGAINFFGYNDLSVYEYYKNVNSSSPFYKKYMRIHIPDIFDTTIDGWNEVDFISNKGNRNNYVKTNLFNLTYKITDEDGYNINVYSLKEVQIKLQKLKLWLRENIIPLSTNIVDITGSAKIPATNYLVHDTSNQVTKFRTEKTGIVINFNYITTLNFSTNYLFSIHFYTTTGFVPDHFELIVKTFSKDSNGKLVPVQYFKVFKTDLEPFNFNIDKNIDPYIYIETAYYGDYGVGYRNTELFNFDEPKNYYLINNNFRYKYYPRIGTNQGYYIIDDDGSLWIVEEYSSDINNSGTTY
jgi:hypothetical protein